MSIACRRQTYRCIMCDPTERHTNLFNMLPNSTLPKDVRTAEELVVDDANDESQSDEVISSHYDASNSFTRYALLLCASLRPILCRYLKSHIDAERPHCVIYTPSFANAYQEKQCCSPNQAINLNGNIWVFCRGYCEVIVAELRNVLDIVTDPDLAVERFIFLSSAWVRGLCFSSRLRVDCLAACKHCCQ